MKYVFLFLSVCVFFACNDDEDIITADPNASPVESCCALDAREISVADVQVFIPNVFSPDNDGINDVFNIMTNGADAVITSFLIRDTDQTMLFFAADVLPGSPGSAWDGSFSGNILTGVFDYSITIEASNGTAETVLGQVCSLPCSDTSEPQEDFGMTENCKFGTQHDGAGGFDENLPSFENFECLE